MSIGSDSMLHASAASAPEIAIVIPIYRHSALLVEAIESALQQEADFGIRIVLVNDGCKFVETDEVCRDYAAAWPNHISYIRKPNGGLSDARNTGIRFALDAWPSAKAVYLLDADNRLRPTAIHHAWSALKRNPDAGWIYPNIDMFGLGHHVDFGGDYSALIHTEINICEAGSLVRRDVFEAGVFFDTDFKQGFEDWDFFLSAVEAGFRGKNIENFGFQYRKRPESMLANSERDGASIRAAMRKKHKALFSNQTLVELEQQELPRYAIYLADKQKVVLTVDPEAESKEHISVDEYMARYWRSLTSGTRYHIPAYLVVTSSKVVDRLRSTGLLHWTLWRLESDTRQQVLSLLGLKRNTTDRLFVQTDPDRNALRHTASILMFNPTTLRDVLLDQGSSWINSLVGPECHFEFAGVEASLPKSHEHDASDGQGTASFDALSLLHRMRASGFRAAALESWEWRTGGIEPRRFPHEIVRRNFDGASVFPKQPDKGRHIGFVLPLVEFGGVEKVALNTAKAMKSKGWTVHLFVTSASDLILSKDWQETFSSVSLMSDPGISNDWNAHRTYMGTAINRWAFEGDHNRILGLMHWLDVVINFHGGGFAAVMGQLKRLGIKTVDSLHLHDMSPLGRPVGNTYLGLAYEHAFDYFMPCSNQLGDWCHAMGVPEEKVVPVPNAPAFALPEGSMETIAEERAERPENGPLRAVFLGRLDRQKGLDRLASAIQGSRARDLPVDWRIIGKGVFEAPPRELEGLIEPPVFDTNDLAAIYEWTDVIVLLSSYEGLPLTILEAMRSGAVVIATDVGANSEVIEHDQNGYLIPLESAAEACVDLLQHLSEDRDRLKLVSRAGAKCDVRQNMGRSHRTFASEVAERRDTVPTVEIQVEKTARANGKCGIR